MRVKKRLANTESKRKEFMPQNRNAPAVKAKRLHWKEHMPNLPIDHLVFLDESGINLRMIRRYGRAIGGKRVVDHAPLTRPRGTTLLSAIRVNKVIAQTRYPGGTTRSKFQQYVQETLLPALNPGDIVVMDNLAAQAGAQVLYLPPYSHDFNPIEKLWSKIKACLRRYRALTFEPVQIVRTVQKSSQCRKSGFSRSGVSGATPVLIWNGVQHQVHCLLGCSLVSYNAVVIQIPDHGQIQHTLFGLDIGNIGHPFAVWCFGLKVPVEKILVSVQLLAYLLPASAAANFRQQAVFFHNTQDRFRVMADCFTVFQPLPHSAVAIGMKTFVLLISDFLCQCGVFLGPVQILYKAVIAASGHRKESAHDKHRILFPVAVNDSIFCLGSHFLSVDCRKSRSSSFSICSRLFSFS